MESISELAARWAVRADAGALGSDEQRELESWLAADSRHRGAYVRARAQWVDLDRLAALHGTARSLPGPEGDLASEQVNGQHAGEVRVMSRRQMLAASVATLTVVGGGLSWMVLRYGPERYASGVGEVRRIALADGSTMVLNTNTEATVNLTKAQRDIHLIRGEALFEVAHDKARPFIVWANDTAVRAVGTAFAVRLEAAQVDVTVTEGVVEVSDRTTPSGSGPVAPSAPRPAAQRVAANQRVLITRAGASEIEPIAVAEANRRLAWRDGMVSFDGESLVTAVNEINRHNRRQIVIDDPLLAAMPVVGVFRATDLEGFSAAAAAALKARAVPDGDVIRLEPVAAPTLN
jgi:transmembrane sensor